MDIDWAVSLVAFVAFVAWALTFYSGLFPVDTESAEDATLGITQTVADFLSVEVTQIPVKVAAGDNITPAAVSFEHQWPSANAKNTTKVLQGSTSLSCAFSGDTLRWSLNLPSGTSWFTVRFTDQNRTQNCEASFPTDNITAVAPGALEKTKFFSQDRINNMTNQTFANFKSSLNINRNFKVQLNQSGSLSTFGPEPPLVTNVYLEERWGRLEENDSAEIRVTVYVW